MLPEPMMATLVLRSCVVSSEGCEADGDVAEPGDRGRSTPSPGADGDHRAERAGEHDLAGAQRVAELAGGAGQPDSARQRVAQAGGAGARGDLLAVPVMVIVDRRRLDVGQRSPALAPSTYSPRRRCRRRCRRSGCPSPAMRLSTISSAATA